MLSRYQRLEEFNRKILSWTEELAVQPSDERSLEHALIKHGWHSTVQLPNKLISKEFLFIDFTALKGAAEPSSFQCYPALCLLDKLINSIIVPENIECIVFGIYAHTIRITQSLVPCLGIGFYFKEGTLPTISWQGRTTSKFILFMPVQLPILLRGGNLPAEFFHPTVATLYPIDDETLLVKNFNENSWLLQQLPDWKGIAGWDNRKYAVWDVEFGILTIEDSMQRLEKQRKILEGEIEKLTEHQKLMQQIMCNKEQIRQLKGEIAVFKGQKLGDWTINIEQDFY